jgi:aminopeptidase
MSLAAYEEFVFTAGLLHLDDPAAAWRQFSQRQQRVADFLNTKREIRFTTPQGTDLKLGVEGRRWINCDGHENFPDGEVFTGPIEDATEGVVVYSFPAVHGGREVEGIRLVFRAGKVVEATARKGEEFLIAMLDQDAGARVLGEVAIGTNYAIKSYSKNTLFDEKIGGTFHAAVGAGYPESGNTNDSGLHWDMVCDLRQGGTVSVDGEVISENGRFVFEGWPGR